MDIPTLTSVTALTISVLSYRQSKTSSKAGLEIAKTNQVNQALQTHSDLLAKIKKKYSPIFYELRNHAYSLISCINNEMDNYEGRNFNKKALRHISSELTEPLVNRFKSEIFWQPPLYIAPQIWEISHLRHNLNNKNHPLWNSKKIKELSQRYIDSLLNKTETYKNTFHQSNKLFLEILEKQSDFKSDLNKLEGLLELSKHEEIQLYNSPKLYQNYNHMVSTLSFLQHFHLLARDRKETDYNHEGQIILILCTLKFLTLLNIDPHD